MRVKTLRGLPCDLLEMELSSRLLGGGSLIPTLLPHVCLPSGVLEPRNKVCTTAT